MTGTDWIGFVGVSLLLVAFLLNLFGKISQSSISYCVLNFIGAALACLASILLLYWPFIVLEGVWMVVSFVSLATRRSKKSGV